VRCDKRATVAPGGRSLRSRMSSILAGAKHCFAVKEEGRPLLRSLPGAGRAVGKKKGRSRRTALPASDREDPIRSPCRPCRRPGRRPGAAAFAGRSATIASVVISSEATEAASCRAVRTTLVGSMMPALDEVRRTRRTGRHSRTRRSFGRSTLPATTAPSRRRSRRSGGPAPGSRGARSRCRSSGRRCRP
jgi:hypothetical protein